MAELLHPIDPWEPELREPGPLTGKHHLLDIWVRTTDNPDLHRLEVPISPDLHRRLDALYMEYHQRILEDGKFRHSLAYHEAAARYTLAVTAIVNGYLTEQENHND